MKKKICIAMMLMMVFFAVGCKSEQPEEVKPEISEIDQVLNDMMVEYWADENAEIDVDSFRDEIIGTEEYRIWDATIKGKDCLVSIPISFTKLDPNDQDELEWFEDFVGCNRSYLIAKKILENHPSLGAINENLQFAEIKSSTTANKDDLRELWSEYQQAKKEIQANGVETSYFVTVTLEDGDTVEFLPYTGEEFNLPID